MFGINLVGQTLQGHYYIKQKLGEGGFGETYLAEDKSKFDKLCVVKRLKPQNQSILRWVQQAFEQEARMLGNLGKHPQIPQLLAYFEEDQEFFLVQEFIDGDNLRKQFSPGVGWSENQVTFLLQSILEVLEFVHQHGVIHRDIKPENIIIRRKDSQIFLIDFGAVKQTTTQVFNTQGQLTATTAIVGTPGYMPMEQINGHPGLCSDIYAVGMIGIEALTGMFPSNIPRDSNSLELVWRNQAQVRNEVADVLNKMVHYHHSKRYKSGAEALQAVRVLTKTYVSLPPPPPPPPPPLPVQEYADFSTRLVADIIDRTILIVGSVIWDLITETSVTNPDEAEFWGRLFGAYIILAFLYCPVMESSNFQGTLGKKLLGITVTDINGNKLSFEQAAKRHSMKLWSHLTIWIGFFMAGWTNKKQALHDKICKTLVLRNK